MTFVVNDQEERNYAAYLSKTYEKLKDFEKKYEADLKHLPESFNRLFFVYGDFVSSHQGKTIHNTQTALNLAHHTSYNFDDHQLVPYEFGHVSHFRLGYRFPQEDIPISDLVFDQNYFQCFFVDHFKNFA